jgi:gliding motility-associated protein GldM
MSAGGTVNPLRQQMINMMYLVLMALLALNVSADILKAFALVNKGLGKTNDDYAVKNAATMTSFKKVYDLDQKKAEKYYNNALEAKKESDMMFKYIEGIKNIIAGRCGGWMDDKHTTIEDDKNLETSLHYFLREPQTGKPHGTSLRDSLKTYIKKMTDLTDGNIKVKIDVDNPPKNKEGDQKSWEEYYWEGVPSIAAITELTKFQNDIKTAEGEVTTYNYTRVGAEEQHFNSLIAMVSSETPTVSEGETYKADIVLGAYNSTVQPKIEVNGNQVKVEEGKGKFETVAHGAGEQTLHVKIYVKNPKTGVEEPIETESKYTIFKGGATISAEKMNMLYIGVDNPISASAAGFTPDQTIVSSSGAPLRKVGNGQYMIHPDVNSARELTITVNVKMSDGKTAKMGAQVYRVRKLPHPEVLFGAKNGGSISRGEIATVTQVNAGLGEGFAFEGLRYNVNAYTIAVVPKSGQAYMEPVSGNRITGASRSRLSNVHTGDMIVIANVDAMGPAGKVMLPGVTLTVK